MVLPAGSERAELGECSLEELSECLVAEQRRREVQARRDWAVYARGVLHAYGQRLARERERDL